MRPIILLMFLLLGLSACGLGAPPAFLPASDAPTAVIIATVAPTPGAANLPSATPPTAVPAATAAGPTSTSAVAAATATTEPTAVPSPTPESAIEATARDLMTTLPPIADDVRLAIAFRGLDPATVAATPPSPETLEVGAVDTFWIHNSDSNTNVEITAELMAVGERAYFWFDVNEDYERPDPRDVEEVAAQFDAIYEPIFDLFGVTEPPGGRVHVVSASASAMCDDGDRCTRAGYFSDLDLLPAAVNPFSNERPMFVMNAWRFDGGNFLDTLSHELRHMLGAGYDAGEEDWFVEGAATMTQDLVGFSDGPQARGNLYLAQTDQQLNSWSTDNPLPHYGQGYLLQRFLYDRLGPSLYREFSLSPEPGLTAVNDMAAVAGRSETGESLWLDWLVALAAHDQDDVPDRYRWLGPPLEEVTTIPVDQLPASFETTVSQWAADYYDLPDGPLRLDFAGAPTVSLLGEQPAASSFWYAHRANEANPRLTRAFDLRDEDAVTLTYRVYADIEQGYDFGYVSVSTDGGVTWQPLAASHMQGLDAADDPSDVALADRYYTGRNQAWVDETIDLSPFVGQEILLRFEYVTDLLITYGGLAIDDITIPELGFRDHAETGDAGWTAEGFTRATPSVPQGWHLQVVTFGEDGGITVQPLPVAADGRALVDFRPPPDTRRSLLIVAASAAETLQPATYRLALTETE